MQVDLNKTFNDRTEFEQDETEDIKAKTVRAKSSRKSECLNYNYEEGMNDDLFEVVSDTKSKKTYNAPQTSLSTRKSVGKKRGSKASFFNSFKSSFVSKTGKSRYSVTEKLLGKQRAEAQNRSPKKRLDF